MGEYSVERFLATSRGLDTTGVEWERVRDWSLTPEALRVLRYFADVEAYTTVYLRDLLNTSLIWDQDIADFLVTWGYEESFHGRTLDKLLLLYDGSQRPPTILERRSKIKLRERFESWLAKVGASLVRDFPAVYLAWGAMQEISTLTGYQRFAKRSGHPVVADVFRRIAVDESRHFGFYYHLAQDRMKTPSAQRLVRRMLSWLWTPVGEGLKPAAEARYTIHYLFCGEDGPAAAAKVDDTIERLPGLAGMRLLSRYVARLHDSAPIAPRGFPLAECRQP